MSCERCGGAVAQTHYPYGIYSWCRSCGWEAAEAYPPEMETAPVLADEGAESTQEERRFIYTTAPDPDGWSTHDQLEWMEEQAS